MKINTHSFKGSAVLYVHQLIWKLCVAGLKVSIHSSELEQQQIVSRPLKPNMDVFVVWHLRTGLGDVTWVNVSYSCLGDEQNELGVWKEGETFWSHQLRSSAETSQRLYHKTE